MAEATSVSVEEHHEKLRRFVDEWSSRGGRILQEFGGISTPLGNNFSCDFWRDPIKYENTEIREFISIPDLIKTGNNISFGKLISVFGYLCCEISSVHDRLKQQFFPQLLVFGVHGKTPFDSSPEGEIQEIFASFFSQLQLLMGYISLLRSFLINMVLQLSSLYPPHKRTKESRPYSYFRESVHMRTCVSSLAKGFGSLATLDAIISHNEAFSHGISSFSRMIQSVQGQFETFGVSECQLSALQTATSALEDAILGGGFFQRCIQEDFCSDPEFSSIRHNRFFVDEISFCLRENVTQITSRLGTEKEHPYDRMELANSLSLFVFLSWIFSDGLDKKVILQAWSIHSLSPLLPLFSIVTLRPLPFLRTHLPPWSLIPPHIKSPLKESMAIMEKGFLTSLDESFPKELKILRRKVNSWVAEMDSCLPLKEGSMDSVLRDRLQLFGKGVFLASRMRHLLLSCTDLHGHLEMPLEKEQVRRLCSLAEMLKVVESVFQRSGAEVAASRDVMLEAGQRGVREAVLEPIKREIESDILSFVSPSTGLAAFTRTLTRSRDMEEKLQDALSAVNLSISLLGGSFSVQRRISFRLTLDVLIGQKRVKEESLSEILSFLDLFELLSDLQNILSFCTDCTFLLWMRPMMTSALTSANDTWQRKELQYILGAFLDGGKLLEFGKVPKKAVRKYEGEIIKGVEEHVIAPLCRSVETDLRFHVHSIRYRGAVSVNPSKTGVRDLNSLLRMKPLRFLFKQIHIRTRVEDYLSSSFYNHSAVALHDWKAYDEMQQLAHEKYGLKIEPVELPGRTREEGTDVLQAVHNMSSFVKNYHYDLHSQVFIEKLSTALHRKHIHTISVRHVASSLLALGPSPSLSLSLSAVNSVYKILALKIEWISHFFFDDIFKSKVGKEAASWREGGEGEGEGGGGVGGGGGGRGGKGREYSVERAEKFLKSASRLGLDALRGVVTEVGNSLALVRTVRMAAARLGATAGGYLPDFLDSVNFEEVSRKGQFSSHTCEAAVLLDASRNYVLSGNSSQKTNYFCLLVDVFSQELGTEENNHLRNFHITVPSLLLSFLSSLHSSKERLHKRGRDATSATFVDDGFILGLVYLLKVLGQDKQFDALHFFRAARKKYGRDMENLRESMDPESDESGMASLKKWGIKVGALSLEEINNTQLLLKKTKSYLSEMELLQFTFENARIFF